MIWEKSIEIHTYIYILPYVKQISSGSLMSDAGNPRPVLCEGLEGWGGEEGGGRGVQEGTMAEAITILESSSKTSK